MSRCVNAFFLFVLAGYDTTFFWLASRAAFEGFDNVKYVEVDYPALVGRKEAMLQQDFFKQFSSESPKHMLLGADLRKTKALQEALVAKCGVDPSLPTILITVSLSIYLSIYLYIYLSIYLSSLTYGFDDNNRSVF